ncbi:MAG: hypothetical protein HY514_05305 [Candidatus Aenigmarchaeota archaeon]|nr:hypothetical protein [Candidatus Aenigmarchaeota archaeon]
MFCIKCGKDAFVGNFCEQCYLEKKDLFILKKVKMRYCDNCGKYYTQKEKVSPEEMEHFISGQIEEKGNIKNIEIKVSKRVDKIHAVIVAKGSIKPSKISITDRKEFSIYPKKIKCNSCAKILGNYHEAVIQIRGLKKENIIREIGKLIKNDELAGILKLKEGYDVKIVDKPVAARAVQILREKFTVKRSFKLVGEKKGRKIYRNFYAVR